jgi:hypothetical protein
VTDCLIWSFEHNAWWAPDECGYVGDAGQAGRYSLERAEEICRRANIAAINEAIVPLPEQRIAANRPTGVSGSRR